MLKRTIGYSLIGMTALLILWWFAAPNPNRIRLGDSEARVVALLGRPQEEKGSPWMFARGTNPFIVTVNSGECVREFVYHRPGADWTTWHVGFSGNGRVVSSYGFRHRGAARGLNVVARLEGPGGERVGW
jgi:hypothetical protein